MLANQEKKHFTYADYCTWDNEPRCELIDGEIYFMAAPGGKHQTILLNLGSEFRAHLRGKECRVFVAPFDVRLNWEKGDNTVVQPDILVVCDRDKLDDKGCKGAPDLVIEILSPSTASYDMMTKFTKYCDANVKEIWFVSPDEREAKIFKQRDGEYFVTMFGEADKIPVGILPELTIDMKDIFEEA
ncbi:MAG: Uma2 family endonuclease [Clostridiales bacterium]|jgi:Uma2 family endonuclease|nr:Uma2 family endonuclease [Clostridiales bacterium]